VVQSSFFPVREKPAALWKWFSPSTSLAKKAALSAPLPLFKEPNRALTHFPDIPFEDLSPRTCLRNFQTVRPHLHFHSYHPRLLCTALLRSVSFRANLCSVLPGVPTPDRNAPPFSFCFRRTAHSFFLRGGCLLSEELWPSVIIPVFSFGFLSFFAPRSVPIEYPKIWLRAFLLPSLMGGATACQRFVVSPYSALSGFPQMQGTCKAPVPWGHLDSIAQFGL